MTYLKETTRNHNSDGADGTDYRFTDTQLGREQRRQHRRSGGGKVGKPRGTSGVKRGIRFQFGTRLMTVRTKRDMTQEDAAKILGVTKQTWSEMERGEVSVTLDRAQEIAMLFGVPVTWFIDADIQDDEVPTVAAAEKIKMNLEYLSAEHLTTVSDIVELFRIKDAEKNLPAQEEPPSTES